MDRVFVEFDNETSPFHSIPFSVFEHGCHSRNR
jgi:hypothetical protein